MADTWTGWDAPAGEPGETTWDDVQGGPNQTRWDVLPSLIGRGFRVLWDNGATVVAWATNARGVVWR